MTTTTNQSEDTMTATIGTGYATVADTGERITYEEADRRQRVEVADPATRDVWQYVSSDAKSVSTWSGGALMRILWHTTGRAGFGYGDMHYWRAIDPDGHEWYGKNAGPGMLLHLRRAK